MTVDEREQGGARSVDVDRRQPMVVGLHVLLARVVQDHPGGAAGGHVETLVDPGVGPSLTGDDLSRSCACRELGLAEIVLSWDVLTEHNRGRGCDAVGHGHTRHIERRSAIGGEVQRRSEESIRGRRTDRGDPRSAVINRGGTGPAVAGGCIYRNPRVEGVKKSQLDRVGVGIPSTGDRVVDDVDVVFDSLLHGCHGVGVEAALSEADAIHDHAGAGSDTADRSALDAEQHRRVDAITRGRRGGVRTVALGVARKE